MEGLLGIPLHFTVEFFGFLVAAGAAVLVLSRPVLLPTSRFNRATAAGGFGSLAAAQLLHGASFVPGGDGAVTLIAVETLGLALLLMAIVSELKGEVPIAPAAVTVHEPLALAPAAAGALLAIIAWAAAVREGPLTLRRLSVGALLYGASRAIVGVDPEAGFVHGASSPYGYAAHTMKLLAFIVLALWVWTAVRSSIGLRFVASFAVLLVLVVLVLSTALTGVISNAVEEEGLNQVRTVTRSQVHELEVERTRTVKTNVESIAEVRLVQRAVANRDGLRRIAADYRRAELFGFDFVVFTAHPRPRLLGWAAVGPFVQRDPEATRRDIRRRDMVKVAGSFVVADALRNGTAASPEDLGGGLVANLAAAQVRHPTNRGRVAGVVAAGRFIDVAAMERIADEDGGATLLSLDGRVVVSSLPDGLSAEDVLPPGIGRRVAQGDIVTRQHGIAGRSYFSGFAPLTSSRGVHVATLVVSADSRIVATTREQMTRTLFIVAMLVAAVVLLLAWLWGRRMTQPIRTLTVTAQRVREGDLAAQSPVRGEDEVGQLGETFNEMTESLTRMNRDLRDAARQEYRLRARIEAIIQSMADGLVAVDQQGRVLAFNRELEHLTGLRAESAIGKPIRELIKVRDVHDEVADLPVFSLGEGADTGIFLVSRSGSRVPVAVTSAVLRDEEGRAVGGVAVFRDVTRDRELERMKSEFLSNISHELRTPLTPIKGYAEILYRKDVPRERSKHFVSGILDSAARLERIVEMLVDFAALEAGRMAPRPKPVDVGALVRKLADDWKKRAPRHHVVARIGDDLPDVMGDERLLRRSLEEVLDNAVKFSPEGGTVVMQARRVTSGDGRRGRAVEVVISDEGIGIPPDEVQSIFSDFRQLDGSVTRTYGGLGLGLSFVQRIIEDHGGNVAVDSKLGEGTTLTINIPAA